MEVCVVSRMIERDELKKRYAREHESSHTQKKNNKRIAAASAKASKYEEKNKNHENRYKFLTVDEKT